MVENLDGRLVEVPLNREGKPKKKFLFCPAHREKILVPFTSENVKLQCKDVTNPVVGVLNATASGMNSAYKVKSKEFEETYKTEQIDSTGCDLPLIPVMYLYRPFLSGIYAGDYNVIQNVTKELSGSIPLAPSEVISVRKREHTELYGRSIIPRLIIKLRVILGLDEMASNAFTNRAYPSHIAIVNAQPDAVSKMETAIESTSKQKNDALAVVSVTGDGNLKNYFDIMRIPTTLESLDYTGLKQGVIKEVNAAFGVDTNSVVTSGGGGVQAQNFQVQVISDVVESDIRMLNEVLDSIVRSLNIKSWVLRLNSPDSKEETAKAAIQQQKLNMVKIVDGMGYTATPYGDDRDIMNIDFKISGTNKLSAVATDAQISQILLQLAQLQAIIQQSEQQELSPQLQGVADNVNSLLGKGATNNALDEVRQRLSKALSGIDSLTKAKTTSEKVFGGKTGGITPTKEMKSPIEDGKTMELPEKAGKGAPIKIDKDGNVKTPKLPGDMSEV